MTKEWQQLSRQERRNWEIKAENAARKEFIATGQWRGEAWMPFYTAKRMFLASTT